MIAYDRKIVVSRYKHLRGRLVCYSNVVALTLRAKVLAYKREVKVKVKVKVYCKKVLRWLREEL